MVLTRVYYDSLCKVCSAEIEHYKKQQGAERIIFIDIFSQEFDAAKENVDPLLVHKVMHVRADSGELKLGVDAFIEIWKQIPKYHWAARLALKRPVRLLLEAGYHTFTYIRPYLPRRKTSCDYCVTGPVS